MLEFIKGLFSPSMPEAFAALDVLPPRSQLPREVRDGGIINEQIAISSDNKFIAIKPQGEDVKLLPVEPSVSLKLGGITVNVSATSVEVIGRSGRTTQCRHMRNTDVYNY